jgi:hypothetical protein
VAYSLQILDAREVGGNAVIHLRSTVVQKGSRRKAETSKDLAREAEIGLNGPDQMEDPLGLRLP